MRCKHGNTAAADCLECATAPAPGGRGPLSYTDRIIAYENGELEEEEVIDLFQGLIDCGLAWQLQGSYGRQAARLIDAGLCHR